MKTKFMFAILAVTLCVLVFWPGCGNGGGGEVIDKGTLVEFSIKTYDGDIVTPEDFRGKVLMVDYWATWCAPCKKEFPEFVKLLESYGDDFVIIAMTVDTEMPVLDKYLGETDWPFIIGMNDGSETPSWPDVSVFPTAFIIDREGYLRGKLKSGHPYEDFDNLIKPLIDEKPAAPAEEPALEVAPDSVGETEDVDGSSETETTGG